MPQLRRDLFGGFDTRDSFVSPDPVIKCTRCNGVELTVHIDKADMYIMCRTCGLKHPLHLEDLDVWTTR
jgi:hypothetical protein